MEKKKSLYKEKILILIALTILLLPLSYAIEECQREQQPKDVPCEIISTWSYSGSCSNYEAEVYYQNATFIQNYTFSDYGTTGLCKFTWNQTTEGTYNFLVSNGDTGGIHIQKFLGVDDKMLTIIVALSIIIVYFFIMGLMNRESIIGSASFFVSFLQLIYMLGIIYVNEQGGILIELLKINFYIMSIVGLGLGLLTLIQWVLGGMDYASDEDTRIFRGSKKYID